MPFGEYSHLCSEVAEVIAIQIRLLEIELRERMRAVDDRFHAVPPGHLTDGFHRRDLPGDVDLMRDLNQTRARRDGAFEGRGDLLDVLWRNRNLDQVELDAFALFALANRRQHAPVVLRRGEHFIAGLQIHPEQQRLEPFRCVARDGDLFAIAAEQFGQPGANRFRLRLENLPHRVSGRVLLLPDVTHQRFGHDARAGTDAAVVQIDDAARDGEGVLNRRPVVFIHRRLFRRQMRD